MVRAKSKTPFEQLQGVDEEVGVQLEVDEEQLPEAAVVEAQAELTQREGGGMMNMRTRKMTTMRLELAGR
jgi:hypothetical protein